MHLFLFQFVIEGVVGTSYHGDIAIDDITENDGACPPSSNYFQLLRT